MCPQSSWEVVFYEKQNGTVPMLQFLDSLETRQEAKVAWTISLLEAKGTELREPYSKPLGDGIFELRVKAGTDISRVLYFFVIGHRIVLTHGFVKKTERTPRAEIERAKKYRTDYERREMR